VVRLDRGLQFARYGALVASEDLSDARMGLVVGAKDLLGILFPGDLEVPLIFYEADRTVRIVDEQNLVPGTEMMVVRAEQ
jgi:hypothetical protein